MSPDGEKITASRFGHCRGLAWEPPHSAASLHLITAGLTHELRIACASITRLTANLLITNGEGVPNEQFRAPRRHGKMCLHTEDRFGPGARTGPFCFQEHAR